MKQINFVYLVAFLFFPTFAFSQQEIAFEVTIPANTFSSTLPLMVTLWTESQLKIRDKNSSCTVSYDVATQKQSLDCPKGVVFEETSPEKFSFKLQDKITFISKSIKQGDKFEISITGKSIDKCNTTSALIQDVVAKEKVVIKDASWMSTEMACSFK